MDKKLLKALDIIFIPALVLLCLWLAMGAFRAWQNQDFDNRRVADMNKLQEAINNYYTTHQVYPFGVEQKGENYQTLVKTYLGDQIKNIPYDPDPAKSGLKNGHPECYQFINGTCWGKYNFDPISMTWFMQVRLDQPTDRTGKCISNSKYFYKYCIANRRIDINL